MLLGWAPSEGSVVPFWGVPEGHEGCVIPPAPKGRGEGVRACTPKEGEQAGGCQPPTLDPLGAQYLLGGGGRCVHEVWGVIVVVVRLSSPPSWWLRGLGVGA